MYKSASPASLPAALRSTCTFEHRLNRKCFSSRRHSRGDGSNAITRPFTPTLFESSSVYKPWCAPTSNTVIPGRRSLCTKPISIDSNSPYMSSWSMALFSASHHAPKGNRSGIGISGKMRRAQRQRNVFPAVRTSQKPPNALRETRTGRGLLRPRIFAFERFRIKAETSHIDRFERRQQNRPPPQMVQGLAEIVMFRQRRYPVHRGKSRAIEHFREASFARITSQ